MMWRSSLPAGWRSCLEPLPETERTGIVGARLYYPDDTIQHAGIVIGIGGVAGSVFVGHEALAHTGYMHREALHAGSERSDGGMHDDAHGTVFEAAGGFDRNSWRSRLMMLICA